MRKPLKKNEFLQQLETLLQKYEYDTMYCKGGFDGTKKGGLSYVIVAEDNPEAGREFNRLIDPVDGMDEYDCDDMSCTSIGLWTQEAIEWLGEPVYEKGEFYAIEG